MQSLYDVYFNSGDFSTPAVFCILQCAQQKWMEIPALQNRSKCQISLETNWKISDHHLSIHTIWRSNKDFLQGGHKCMRHTQDKIEFRNFDREKGLSPAVLQVSTIFKYVSILSGHPVFIHTWICIFLHSFTISRKKYSGIHNQTKDRKKIRTWLNFCSAIRHALSIFGHFWPWSHTHTKLGWVCTMYSVPQLDVDLMRDDFS